MSTRVEPPSSEAARGADVLVRRALRLLPGDRVDVLHHDSAVVEGLVRAAAARAGVQVEVHDLTPLVHETSAARLRTTLRGLLSGATASVLLARGGLPQVVSVAVVRAAGELRTRHVHMPNVDPRALGSSVRADPDTLGAINARLVERLGAGATVHVTSEAGTDLTVKLGAPYPLVADHGCPEPGKWDNLPAGFVYAHPLEVHGTLVADRIAHGSTASRLGASLRRKPLRVTFEGAAPRARARTTRSSSSPSRPTGRRTCTRPVSASSPSPPTRSRGSRSATSPTTGSCPACGCS